MRKASAEADMCWKNTCSKAILMAAAEQCDQLRSAEGGGED